MMTHGLKPCLLSIALLCALGSVGHAQNALGALPPGAQNNPAQPTPTASTDQVASANLPAQPERSEGDRALPDAATSVEAPEAASDPSHDPDDPNWPKPVAASLAEEHTELPAPDEQAFSVDCRPWRTVKLADGSETAVYLALDAVPQWTDPPGSVTGGPDNAELPAPAIPYYQDYQGAGDGMGAVAE